MTTTHFATDTNTTSPACGSKARSPELSTNPFHVDCGCCERTMAFKVAYRKALAARKAEDKRRADECAAQSWVKAYAELAGITPQEVANLTIEDLDTDLLRQAKANAAAWVCSECGDEVIGSDDGKCDRCHACRTKDRGPDAHKGTLAKAAAAITSDLDSSRRHWQQVRDGAAVRRDAANGDERYRKHNDYECRVAEAALALIDDEGRAPASLFLGEAADELGVAYEAPATDDHALDIAVAKQLTAYQRLALVLMVRHSSMFIVRTPKGERLVDPTDQTSIPIEDSAAVRDLVAAGLLAWTPAGPASHFTLTDAGRTVGTLVNQGKAEAPKAVAPRKATTATLDTTDGKLRVFCGNDELLAEYSLTGAGWELVTTANRRVEREHNVHVQCWTGRPDGGTMTTALASEPMLMD